VDFIHSFFLKIDYALTSFFLTGGISSKGETLFLFQKEKRDFGGFQLPIHQK
jgi:hypothetical protein